MCSGKNLSPLPILSLENPGNGDFEILQDKIVFDVSTDDLNVKLEGNKRPYIYERCKQRKFVSDVSQPLKSEQRVFPRFYRRKLLYTQHKRRSIDLFVLKLLPISRCFQL